jgi:hypothetical protein
MGDQVSDLHRRGETGEQGREGKIPFIVFDFPQAGEKALAVSQRFSLLIEKIEDAVSVDPIRFPVIVFSLIEIKEAAERAADFIRSDRALREILSAIADLVEMTAVKRERPFIDRALAITDFSFSHHRMIQMSDGRILRDERENTFLIFFGLPGFEFHASSSTAKIVVGINDNVKAFSAFSQD